MSKELTLTEVIHKSALVSLEDVKPLVSYLKYDDNLSSSADSCKKLADYLRKMGSNDIANLFRDDFVNYKTVVYEVAERLGADKEQNIPREVIGLVFPNIPLNLFKKTYSKDDFTVEQWEERIIM